MIRPLTTASGFRISFISWWLVWIFVQWMVVSSYGFSLGTSFTDSLVCNLLLAASCLLITNNMKYYLPQKERYWYVLLTSVVVIALWLLVAKTALKIFFSNNTDYLLFLDRSVYVRYVIGFLMTGCMSIMGLLWFTLL